MDSGVAKLVGGDPVRLAQMLDEGAQPGSWAEAAARVENPFGRGDSGQRIVDVIPREMTPGNGVESRKSKVEGADQAEPPTFDLRPLTTD